MCEMIINAHLDADSLRGMTICSFPGVVTQFPRALAPLGSDAALGKVCAARTNGTYAGAPSDAAVRFAGE